MPNNLNMPRLREEPLKKRAKISTKVKLEEAIKSAGFRSPNDFILKYYESVQGIQSLRAQEDKSYGPTKMLDAWTRNVPKGSEDILNMAIIIFAHCCSLSVLYNVTILPAEFGIGTALHGNFLIYIALQKPYFDPRPSPAGRFPVYPDWSCVETSN
jgi:hypothetical protein